MKHIRALIFVCMCSILSHQCLGQRQGHGQGQGQGRPPVDNGNGQGNGPSRPNGQSNGNNGNNGNGQSGGPNNPHGSGSNGNQGNGHGSPHSNVEADLPPQFVNVNDRRGPPVHANGRRMPRSLELRFHITQQDMTLNLTWNKHVNDAATIVIGTGRNNMKKYKKKNKKEFGLYFDPDTKASVMVRENKKKPNVLDYMGSFFIDDDEYTLEPTDWDMDSWDTLQSLHQQADPGNTHMVYKKRRNTPEEDYELDERSKKEKSTDCDLR